MNLRKFTSIMGWIFLLIGVLGFIPGLLTPPHVGDPSLAATDSYGRFLGLFPVNSIHNMVHLVFGLWGVTASKDLLASRKFCKANCVIYGVLAVMGLIPGLNTLFRLMPIHSHDIWLHAGIAIATGYFGFAWGVTRKTVTNAPSDQRLGA
ncbi:MAG: hypothetical protein A4S09_12995 [Proteobacteria bacterium SG_bin7]|nr:MAG: hypothetical protein A4S09_12995 [Proteobacteria bacterium SG_bin7]